MTTRSFTVTGPTLIHNQDIARFIECANSYKSVLSISNGEGSINAKSMLGVLALHITEGTEVELTADGPDEAEALDALVARLAG